MQVSSCSQLRFFAYSWALLFAIVLGNLSFLPAMDLSWQTIHYPKHLSWNLFLWKFQLCFARIAENWFILSTFCASFVSFFFPLPTIPFLPASLLLLEPQNCSVSWRKRNLQGLACGEGFGGWVGHLRHIRGGCGAELRKLPQWFLPLAVAGNFFRKMRCGNRTSSRWVQMWVWWGKRGAENS